MVVSSCSFLIMIGIALAALAVTAVVLVSALATEEAINNAVKYSACTKIEIKITEQEGKISVIITDNGKGFNLNEISGGSGLKNMKTRAEKIHCQLTITSGPLLGTEIKLEQKNKI